MASGVSAEDGTPPFGFTNVQGALDGIKSVLVPTPTGGGSLIPLTLSRRLYIPGIQGRQSSSATGFVGVGAIRFDPADYRPTVPPGGSPALKHVRFGALIESSGGLTGTVRLYDLSVATGVPDSVLASTVSTPTYVLSPDLDLSADVDYEVQVSLGSSATGPTGADEVVVKMARLEVEHE